MLVCFAIVWLIWPQLLVDTLYFVLTGMIEVAPLVIPGILISAWVNASGAGDRIRRVFEGNRLKWHTACLDGGCGDARMWYHSFTANGWIIVVGQFRSHQ